MKKLALILLSAMLISSFAACADASNDTASADTTAETSAETNVEETTTADPYEADIPDDLDFEGYEFKLYSRYAPLYFNSPMDVEEENGDVINDAIYRRNRIVEERLNISFSEELYENKNNEAPRKLMMSADATYDMYMANVQRAFSWSAEGIIRDINDLEYIDLEKPYWDQSLNGALNIGGKQLFIQGAYNLSSYDFTHTMLFNKKLADALSIEDLYSLVDSGKWTFDKFHDIAKTAVADLNGDSIMDANDRYGYITQPKQVLPCFWMAAGVTCLSKDADGYMRFSALSDEKFSTVYEKIFDLTKSDNLTLTISTNEVAKISAPFIADQGLFYNANCYRISDLRDMDTDFGILPYPKWDEEQELYYTRIEGCEMPVVPLTNTDMERTGAIFELICAESVETTINAYYDVTLTGKYARDDESLEMLDIIFSNRIFDYADTVYVGDLRDSYFQSSYTSDNRDLISGLSKLENTINSKLNVLNGEN